MSLVAGIDSSTQSVKVVVRDAESGRLVRSGRASHPDGTEVDPAAWWGALSEALARAGGLTDVSATSVGGQQHGMVALDEDGQVVRDALLWNDTRSAGAAEDLIAELGDGSRLAGAAAWAEATGSVPVASYTVTKLRWLRDAEPGNAARVAAVALPHDWLTWSLLGSRSLADLVTDRSDASGTGYFSAATGEYRHDLLARALGHDALVPRVVPPGAVAATARLGGHDVALGAGAGDNAAAALGLGAAVGDVVVSVGTSGVVSARSRTPTADASGLVSGFADATGHFLPLACTLNGARVLDALCRVLGVDHDRLAALALAAPAGADGLILVPWFEGERTPNLPTATASWHGMTLANATPEHLARAAYEAIACSLAIARDAIEAQGIVTGRVLLVGGAARSAALPSILAHVWDREVAVPPPGEYVADGAARQAAWALSGAPEAPTWASTSGAALVAAPSLFGAPGAEVLARYREVTARLGG